MGELEGKCAVITGAGSGMAKASAQVFVREGARVLAADISGRQEDTATELGDAVIAFHCDVSKEDQVAAMFDTALREFGRVDSALHVAGTGVAGPLADVAMTDYDSVLDVDLRGVLLCTKYAVRAMRDTGGGSIINWSSLGGLNASGETSIYSAAKAGVIAVTKAAAVEYGKVNIRANVLCPGLILTEMGRMGAEMFPALVTASALGRAGEPHEVAELAAFLASDRATFISGAVIPVDGGQSCHLR